MYHISQMDVKEVSPLLGSIYSSSKKLFVKYKSFDGKIFDNCLAVVGSRRMTNYGERLVRKLVPQLADNGISVVSGFMFGVDATAHSSCIEAGGKTIAVMPCGINFITPAYQENLYYSILDSGGIIMSEYEDKAKPQKWMFSKRNEIVAGLCKGVLIVEAENNSGSMITAEYAKKFGRKLFAIPGNIDSRMSLGSNTLLKEGATVVTDASDILTFYGIKNKKKNESINMTLLSTDEQIVYSKIKNKVMTKNEIINICDMEIGRLNAAITHLLVKGIVSDSEGSYYVN